MASDNDYEGRPPLNIPYCDKYFDIPFSRRPLRIDNWKALNLLKDIIHENGYDFIHCNTPVGGAIGRMAAKNLRRSGTKILYTAHGLHFYRGAPLWNWILYYPIEKWLTKHTDLLITINSEDYQQAQKWADCAVIKMPGVGFGVNHITSDESVAIRQEVRSKYGIPMDSFVLLSVGELNANKNHKAVIHGMAKIAGEKPYYIICGEGSLKGTLEKTVEKLGLKKYIIFTGYINNVQEICHAADTFIFPSKREGLPVSMLEAMKVGLPIICSDIRGNRDLVLNQDGGLLIDCKKPEQIAGAISYVMGNPDFRKAASQRNVCMADRFATAKVVESISGIYKELLNEED